MGKIEYPMYGQTPDRDELRTSSELCDYAIRVLGGKYIPDYINHGIDYVEDGFEDVVFSSGIYMNDAISAFNDVIAELSNVNSELVSVYSRFKNTINNTYTDLQKFWWATDNAIEQYANASKVAQTNLANNISNLSNKLDKLGL